MEIPQHITESLANGLTSKPIEVDYPKVSKKKFNKTMKNYYKSLEAMGIKRDSGNRQG